VCISDYRILLLNQSLCSHLWLMVTINTIGFILHGSNPTPSINKLYTEVNVRCRLSKMMHKSRSFKIHLSSRTQPRVMYMPSMQINNRHSAKEWTHPVHYVRFMQLFLTSVKRQWNNSENKLTQTTTTPRNANGGVASARAQTEGRSIPTSNAKLL